MTQEKGIRSYRDLLVWQKGMALAKQVYLLTKSFPVDERFGMVAQMRRAAVSVPSNIAEGQARHGKKEFVQFLSHAQGSLAELDTQIELAVEVGVLEDSRAVASSSLVGELQRMISSLRHKIEVRLATDKNSSKWLVGSGKSALHVPCSLPGRTVGTED